MTNKHEFEDIAKKSSYLSDEGWEGTSSVALGITSGWPGVGIFPRACACLCVCTTPRLPLS